MIRVLTVHWRSDAWIDVQRRYLERFVAADFAVYAALEGVDPAWFPTFHFAADLAGSHPEKLDQLAEIADRDADDDDLLVFLDGDAFPIAPLSESALGGRALAAVRRDEDLGECYPHPSFCVTTSGFWRELGSTWVPGPIVHNSRHEPITDVGCTLLLDLERAGVSWAPILRSNRTDLHPLWFGVYGDLVYHHGAGFRERAEHVDAPGLLTINPRVAARMTRTPPSVPLVHRAERSLRYRAAERRRREFRDSDAARDVDELAGSVYDSILTDPDFFLRFTGDPLPGQ